MEIMGLDEFNNNTNIEEIVSENVNLISLCIDESGSMNSFLREMKENLQKFKDSIQTSKEVDEILVSRINFNSSINIQGYKFITELNTDFTPGGSTSLYDTIINAGENIISYQNELRKNGVRTKAVLAIFSDGEDNNSYKTLNDAKHMIEKLNNMEIITAFISFGPSAKGIGQKLEFKNILELNSSTSELRKAFDCLSKSVISASKSVNTTTDNFFV